MPDFSIGALDQSAINMAATAQDALRETATLAIALEAMGYTRFWLAEHHNTPAFAISAPEIMIAHIAAHTSRLRIGSGGIMLPHYSPLKIAEQFRMLEALAPNRIDLGIGRAPGGDPRTAAALQPGPQAYPVDVFPQQVELLRQFLEDSAGLTGDAGGFPPDHPYLGIRAQPMGDTIPPIYMLGSGGDGAIHAGQFGLPYVYAHFINPDNMRNAIHIYREHFKPSRQCPEPIVMVGISVLAAPTKEEADAAAKPRNIWGARLRLNQAGQFLSMEEAAAYTPSPEEAAIIAGFDKRGLTGSADFVASGLAAMAKEHNIDEFLLLTLTPDNDARHLSYKLLADTLLGQSNP